MLKTPVLYHKKEDVDNIVFTCCALHNQLHKLASREAGLLAEPVGPHAD